MMQKYKVFFNDKAFVLTDSFELFLKGDNGFLSTYHNRQGIEQLIEKINTNELMYIIYLFYEDMNELIFQFRSVFTIIEAAGGLVKNKNGDALIIKRFNKWDLPKGKVHKNEDHKEAAVREVEEECGIKNLKITRNLTPTHHTYVLNGERMLKTTYWYEMEYSGPDNFVPQEDEGITKVKWFRPEKMDAVVNNTYLSLVDVLEEGKVLPLEYKPTII